MLEEKVQATDDWAKATKENMAKEVKAATKEVTWLRSKLIDTEKKISSYKHLVKVEWAGGKWPSIRPYWARPSWQPRLPRRMSSSSNTKLPWRS